MHQNIKEWKIELIWFILIELTIFFPLYNFCKKPKTYLLESEVLNTQD